MRLSLSIVCAAFLCLALPAHGDKAWLEQFYDAMDGPNWTDDTDWKSDTVNFCSWKGITCRNGDLRSIVLVDNNLTGELIDLSTSVTSFRFLNLRGNDVTDVPDDLSSYQGLRTLRLSGSLSEIPDLTNLPSLRTLELSATSIVDFTSWPGFGNLNNLVLDGNDYQTLSWSGLPSLNSLTFTGSALTTLPAWGGLSATEINFSGNQLTTLPPWTGLTATTIDFSGNKIKTITSWADLPTGVILKLNSNKIETIPDTWEGLEDATELQLEDNFISTLPSTWEHVGPLMDFDLHNNLIKELPPTWEGLEGVVSLRLQLNRIRIIPNSWDHLGAAERILLNNNQIIAIPDSWVGLDGVTNLNLARNDIRGIIPADTRIDGLVVDLTRNELCGTLADSNTDVKATGGANWFNCDSGAVPTWCTDCSNRCRPGQAACCPDDQYLVQLDGYTGGECRYNCPRGTYQDADTYEICTPCTGRCETCFGPSEDECFSCNEGSFLQGTSCKDNCNGVSGTFGRNGVCVPCPFECAECDADGCTTCEEDFPLKNGGKCVRNCPSGTYEDNSSACQPCTNGCKECTSDTECLSCSDTSEYLNAGDQTCVTSCQGSTYTDETNKLCRACASVCTSCTGPSRNCN